ncbi:MAG: fluoride efflux transporter CrcB [Nitrospirae bacterium]|nr:fluoride efflux transporter CrcB [Nitrospirota bacterium]
MRLVLAVGLAGFFGAVARYLLGGWVYRLLPGTFPFGTLFVNVLGSLLLGVVFQLGTERAALSPELRVALATGFLGAFTTFSTFSLETVNLLREGSLLMALANVGGNVLLCLGAAWLGLGLVRLL